MGFQIENGVLKKYKEDSEITSIVIPDGVTEISKCAFSLCKLLKSITIPEYVTAIDKTAFKFCPSLTNIDVKLENNTYSSLDGVLYNKSVSKLLQCPQGKTSITIPDSVIEIGSSAFEKCTLLTSITIPDNVTTIDNQAFSWCTSLTSITIPNSVTAIYDSAFEGCTSLKSITIPDSVTMIGNYAFSDCDSLNSITIPDSVTEIGFFAFCGCDSLTNITIPNSITTIGKCAFEYCSSLTSVTIPDSVATIGGYAFDGCDSLKELTIFGYTLDSIQWNWDNVFPSDVKSMLDSKDYSAEMDSPTKYHIVTQVFFQDSQPEAENYIKKNALKIIKHFIDLDDYNTVKSLLDYGKFVTTQNISKLIEHAIEHTQNGGDMQIQLLLTNYKYENFGI